MRNADAALSGRHAPHLQKQLIHTLTAPGPVSDPVQPSLRGAAEMVGAEVRGRGAARRNRGMLGGHSVAPRPSFSGSEAGVQDADRPPSRTLDSRPADSVRLTLHNG